MWLFWDTLFVILFDIDCLLSITDQMQKSHASLIKNDCMRSPRVQTFQWHSPNRDVHLGEFQPYGPIRDHTGPYGAIQGSRVSYGAIWDHRGQFRTIWAIWCFPALISPLIKKVSAVSPLPTYIFFLCGVQPFATFGSVLDLKQSWESGNF